MIRKLNTILILTLLLLLSIIPVVFAQAEGLTLKLSKDFGYAWAGDIQGTFSMKASGPDNLARVEFLIDGLVVGEDKESPFRFQFSTSNYVLGPHTLSALGYTSEDKVLPSNEIQTNFVSPESGWRATGSLVLPILGITFGIILLSFLVPWFLSRNKPKGTIPLGAPRSYGVVGGAICSKCGRPFSRHLLAPNLMFGKLERCPHCGKFGIVPRATPAQLAAAEAAELEMTTESEQVPVLNEEERLQRDLDDSRYEEL
jgi:hypothetical protein